ncbi:Ribonuclease HII [subsurface metagenome]
MPENFDLPLLDDSKKLSKRIRYELREKIIATAKSWAVAYVNNKAIDKINILNASILAMHKAIKKLDAEPGFLLIDGNRFKPYKSIPYSCIIKGDGKFCAIAAASILAKTYRDDFMKKTHNQFPEYDWVNNKGYPTVKHRKTISEMGITPYHRKTFRYPTHTL